MKEHGFKRFYDILPEYILTLPILSVFTHESSTYVRSTFDLVFEQLSEDIERDQFEASFDQELDELVENLEFSFENDTVSKQGAQRPTRNLKKKRKRRSNMSGRRLEKNHFRKRIIKIAIVLFSVLAECLVALKKTWKRFKTKKVQIFFLKTGRLYLQENPQPPTRGHKKRRRYPKQLRIAKLCEYLTYLVAKAKFVYRDFAKSFTVVFVLLLLSRKLSKRKCLI